ncbi:MAG: hypothetical protein HC866_27160 [Leptolyngbyaceae cyanobacterium RU_5_1]|nr:hypothetical protein [Leptolyngbyaceae cyanobacterium RU_5_1]
MQLDLLVSFRFPAGSWARVSHAGTCVVIWISDPYAAAQAGLVRQLLDAGATSRGTERLDDGVAACLSCPNWLKVALLNTLPPPTSHGSRTHGNLLP